MTARLPPTGDLVLGDIGACIYCGATDGLQTEHLIPFSLSGRHVLLNASCAACAARTSRWESKVAHDSFLAFRTILGLPTRRRRHRPSSFQAKVRRGGTWTAEDLDLTRYTAVAPFPKLPEPGAIPGQPLSTMVLTHGAVGLTVTANDGRDSHPARRAGVDAIETAIPYEPVPFMRMIAKIAWGYTVAQYGLDAIEPTVIAVILGTDHHVAHWVGSPEPGWTLFDTPSPADLHVCVVVREDGWVLSGIQLFGPQGAPEYQVVVGRTVTAINADAAGEGPVGIVRA